MILKSLSPFCLLLSLSLSLIGQIVLAGDCSTKDMSAELGAVRSQGNIGWCYPNTAADLISINSEKIGMELKPRQFLLLLGTTIK